MADLFLSKAVDLTTTNATVVYTVPASDDTAVPPVSGVTSIVKSILVSEDSGNADTITVTVTRSSAVFSLFKVTAVAANTTVELLSQPLVLIEGDIIKATAATANRLHITMSILEIT